MGIVVIANDKGGVGKSLVAQGIILAGAEKGITPAILEVESSPRLSKIFDGVQTITPPIHDPDTLYRDPDAIFSVWDDVASAALESASGAVVDIGANLFRPFLRWNAAGGARRLKGGAGMTVVAVMTMDRNALSAGLDALQEAGETLPQARRIAVLNSSIADFIEGDKKIAGAIKKAEGSGSPIEQIRLDRMTAPAWGHIMNMGRLDRAIVDPEVERELMEFLPEGKVTRSLAVYQTWYTSLIRTLMGVLE